MDKPVASVSPAANVVIHRVGPSVQDSVRELLEAMDWQSLIPEGADVALKVNLTHDMLMPGSNTSPWVVEGVVQTIKDRVGTIYLTDADQVLIKVATAFRRSGLGPICEKYSLNFHNLSSGSYEIVERDLGGETFRFKYPEFLRTVTTITLPVLKTHFRCMITGADQEVAGTVTWRRYTSSEPWTTDPMERRGDRLVATLVKKGILTEITGQRRNRVFVFADYYQLFNS
jgi:uncharacterized protein (DUF362 family)